MEAGSHEWGSPEPLLSSACSPLCPAVLCIHQKDVNWCQLLQVSHEQVIQGPCSVALLLCPAALPTVACFLWAVPRPQTLPWSTLSRWQPLWKLRFNSTLLPCSVFGWYCWWEGLHLTACRHLQAAGFTKPYGSSSSNPAVMPLPLYQSCRFLFQKTLLSWLAEMEAFNKADMRGEGMGVKAGAAEPCSYARHHPDQQPRESLGSSPAEP